MKRSWLWGSVLTFGCFFISEIVRGTNSLPWVRGCGSQPVGHDCQGVSL